MHLDFVGAGEHVRPPITRASPTSGTGGDLVRARANVRCTVIPTTWGTDPAAASPAAGSRPRSSPSIPPESPLPRMARQARGGVHACRDCCGVFRIEGVDQQSSAQTRPGSAERDSACVRPPGQRRRISHGVERAHGSPPALTTERSLYNTEYFSSIGARIAIALEPRTPPAVRAYCAIRLITKAQR